MAQNDALNPIPLPSNQREGFEIPEIVKALIGNSDTYTREIYPETNLFVPNFGLLEMMIHEMAKAAERSHYLSQELRGSYHEYNDRLYYAVLFNYSILHQMHMAGRTSYDQQCFLTFMREKYPMENLLVAGPLKPYFEALNSSKPQDDSFGIVVPWKPDIRTSPLHAGNDCQTYNMPYMHLLPDMVSLIRAHAQAKLPQPVAANQEFRFDNDVWVDDAKPLAPNVANNTWQGNRSRRWIAWRPGFSSPSGPLLEANRYRDNQSTVAPPMIFHDREITSELAEHGFDIKPYWFNQLLTTQQRICRYWPGSTTLDRLVARDNGTGKHVLEYYRPDDTIQNHVNDAAVLNAAHAHEAGPLIIVQARREQAFHLMNAIRLEDPIIPWSLRGRRELLVREPISVLMNQNLATVTGINETPLIQHVYQHFQIAGLRQIRTGPYWNEQLKHRGASYIPLYRYQPVPSYDAAFSLRPL
jgi:hypothetical protein